MVREHVYTYEEVEALYRRFNPTAVDGEGVKVLVADDTAAMRKIMADALRRKGCEVVEAENGMVAIDLIEKEVPDLLVLDIQMPEVDGLAVLETVRCQEEFADTPVIMVTARKTKQDILLASKYNVSAYVVKPFQMQDFLAKVAEVINLNT